VSYVATRVRIKIKTGKNEIETSGLVNTGFETTTPDIVLPLEAAKALGLWPPRRAKLATVETGGGEVELFYIEESIELSLIDRPNKKLSVNVIVDPHIREVILSDYVCGVLGMVLLDLKRGYWRLVDDPEDIVRETVEPKTW